MHFRAASARAPRVQVDPRYSRATSEELSRRNAPLHSFAKFHSAFQHAFDLARPKREGVLEQNTAASGFPDQPCSMLVERFEGLHDRLAIFRDQDFLSG